MILVKNIWFAGFLTLEGFKEQGYNIIGKGKGEFLFDLSEEETKKLKLKYKHSDHQKMESAQEELKNLCYIREE